MAKKNITIQQLFIYDQQAQAKQGTIDEIFDAGKINAFYRENGVRINSSYEKRDKILREFCVMENNKVVFEDEQKQTPKMLEGKEQGDFTKAIQDLLSTVIAIEI